VSFASNPSVLSHQSTDPLIPGRPVHPFAGLRDAHQRHRRKNGLGTEYLFSRLFNSGPDRQEINVYLYGCCVRTRVFVPLLAAVAVDATRRAGPLSAPHQSSLKARSRITMLVRQTRTHTISGSGCCYEMKGSLRIRPLSAPEKNPRYKGGARKSMDQFVLLVMTADGCIIRVNTRDERGGGTPDRVEIGSRHFELTRFIENFNEPGDEVPPRPLAHRLAHSSGGCRPAIDNRLKRVIDDAGPASAWAGATPDDVSMTTIFRPTGDKVNGFLPQTMSDSRGVNPHSPPMSAGRRRSRNAIPGRSCNPNERCLVGRKSCWLCNNTQIIEYDDKALTNSTNRSADSDVNRRQLFGSGRRH